MCVIGKMSVARRQLIPMYVHYYVKLYSTILLGCEIVLQSKTCTIVGTFSEGFSDFREKWAARNNS